MRHRLERTRGPFDILIAGHQQFQRHIADPTTIPRNARKDDVD
jgi:hypothetical protein